MKIVYLKEALADAVSTMETARDSMNEDAKRFAKQKMPDIAKLRDRRANTLTAHTGVLRRILEALNADGRVELESGGEA